MLSEQTQNEEHVENNAHVIEQRVLIKKCWRYGIQHDNVVVLMVSPWRKNRNGSGGHVYIRDCEPFGIAIPEGKDSVKINVTSPEDIVAYLGDAPYVNVDDVAQEVNSQTPDNVVMQRIEERFDFSKAITRQLIEGDYRLAVFSGPGGLGKSFLVEQEIKQAQNENLAWFNTIKGECSAVMLYKLLWENRSEAHVLIFDDCDGILKDLTCLNMLKAATDSAEVRTIDWKKDSNVLKNSDIPNEFTYYGRIIIITNIDFDTEIARNNALSPHLDALKTRGPYINFLINTPRERALRVISVLNKTDMLENAGQVIKDNVVEFISTNSNKFSSLTLRTAITIAKMLQRNPDTWRRMAAYQFFDAKKV